MAHSIIIAGTDPVNTRATTLQDSVWRLADHFEADGMDCLRARLLAHQVLGIDAVELDAALQQQDAESAAARADLAQFVREAEAFAASYSASQAATRAKAAAEWAAACAECAAIGLD